MPADIFCTTRRPLWMTPSGGLKPLVKVTVWRSPEHAQSSFVLCLWMIVTVCNAFLASLLFSFEHSSSIFFSLFSSIFHTKLPLNSLFSLPSFLSSFYTVVLKPCSLYFTFLSSTSSTNIVFLFFRDSFFIFLVFSSVLFLNHVEYYQKRLGPGIKTGNCPCPTTSQTCSSRLWKWVFLPHFVDHFFGCFCFLFRKPIFFSMSMGTIVNFVIVL